MKTELLETEFDMEGEIKKLIRENSKRELAEIIAEMTFELQNRQEWESSVQ